MPEEKVILTHKCVFTAIPAEEGICRQLTNVVSRNREGCCRAQCRSPWRVCHKCLSVPEKDRGKGRVDPETGLCQLHGGVVQEEVETPLEQIVVGHEVLVIPVEDIAPLPDQPRKFFDSERLEALTESIKHRGQLQPGLVVALPEGPFRYELRDGERRLRACKMAGVPFRAILQTSVDKGRNESLLTSAVANFNREGHTPWEEIDLVRRLLEPCPDTGVRFTQAQVAESLGHRSLMWVSSRKVVGERLSKTALRHIAENPKIPFATIKHVADLPDEKQMQVLHDYQEGKLGGQKLATLAATYRRSAGRSRQQRPSDLWDQGRDAIGVLEQRVERIADIFSPEHISGDMKALAFERGGALAARLEAVAAQITKTARSLRNVR